MSFSDTKLLEIKDLSISFYNNSSALTDQKLVVDKLGFAIYSGERFSIVGESGSGKSVTCAAILGLLPKSAKVQGSIFFDGQKSDLAVENEDFSLKLRGRGIAYIPQNPVTSLNPVRGVFAQMLETARVYYPQKSANELKELCLSLLRDVQLDDDLERMQTAYPHELSGGMCQRVMIALSLLGEPKLLIADEATTALDVTIQAEIMSLLIQTTQKRGLSLLLITHDLPLVAQTCTRLAVIKNGKLCEEGPVEQTFAQPKHEYTQKLLQAIKL
jgi:ABC-type dipeptide/oligopeptide/nickel transport system ATPase component